VLTQRPSAVQSRRDDAVSLETEDRERLGLGLKAYRIIAPRLHR